MVWNVDPILIRLGPVEVRYYGLFFVAALLGGYYWWRWQIMRSGRNEAAAEKLLLPAAFSVVVGARIAHMVFYDFSRLAENPISLLYVWQGGLSSHGATVGLMLVLWWYARSEKMPLLEVADRFALSSAWGAAMVRIGNLLNSEIVGRVTTSSLGFKFPRFDAGLPLEKVPYRHPSQIYEFLLGIGVLAFLVWLDRKLGGEKRKTGIMSAAFLASYFGGRFFVEYFKAYEAVPESFPLTMGQMLSAPFALAGIAGLFVFSRRRS